MKHISLPEVEYLAHSLAKKFMSWDEPIPEFATRFPDILESCLAAPFQTFSRKSLYTGLVDKGAILYYLMVKNNPFRNGNKRNAVTTLLLFLYKNNKWLSIDNVQLYRFAKWVAESSPDVKEATVDAIRKIINTYITPYTPPKIQS